MLDNFSAYNTTVNQVEAAADHLHQIAAEMAKKKSPDPILAALREEIIKAAQYLDAQALHMTGIYDFVARGYFASGLRRDPRRELFQKRPATAWSPTPPDPERPAIEKRKRRKQLAAPQAFCNAPKPKIYQQEERQFCTLIEGHDGLHRALSGAEWTTAASDAPKEAE